MHFISYDQRCATKGDYFVVFVFMCLHFQKVLSFRERSDNGCTLSSLSCGCIAFWSNEATVSAQKVPTALSSFSELTLRSL